jgi:hypothetical protein
VVSFKYKCHTTKPIPKNHQYYFTIFGGKIMKIYEFFKKHN